MIELGEQAEALRGAMSEGLAWLASNSLAILIAVLAGAVLVAILLGVRSLGVWLGPGAHPAMFRVIAERKSVESGKRVSVRVDLGGRRISIKKQSVNVIRDLL